MAGLYQPDPFILNPSVIPGGSMELSKSPVGNSKELNGVSPAAPGLQAPVALGEDEKPENEELDEVISQPRLLVEENVKVQRNFQHVMTEVLRMNRPLASSAKEEIPRMPVRPNLSPGEGRLLAMRGSVLDDASLPLGNLFGEELTSAKSCVENPSFRMPRDIQGLGANAATQPPSLFLSQEVHAALGGGEHAAISHAHHPIHHEPEQAEWLDLLVGFFGYLFATHELAQNAEEEEDRGLYKAVRPILSLGGSRTPVPSFSIAKTILSCVLGLLTLGVTLVISSEARAGDFFMTLCAAIGVSGLLIVAFFSRRL